MSADCDCFAQLWPKYRFASADPEQVESVAAAVRHAASHTLPSPLSTARIAKALGITVKRQTLYAVKGGIEAMLMPRLSGGFNILVDPSPGSRYAPSFTEISRQEHTRRRRLLIEYRIGHELGHTFFYGSPQAAQPQQRIRRNMLLGEEGRLEETWCDAFAVAILAPDQSVTGRRLLRQWANPSRRSHA